MFLCWGAGLGLSTTVLFNLFPEWLIEKNYSLFGATGNFLIALLLALVAVLSLPMSRFAERRPIYLTITVSVVASFPLIGAILFLEHGSLLTVLLVIFAAFYAMMSVSFLPLALSVVKDRQKVFGVGIFFAGFELPNGVLEAILVSQGTL